MKKNYPLKLIKSRHSYTYDELSEKLKVHTRTIQTWKKEGLRVYSESKPHFIMGFDLIEFLKKKLESRRIKLDFNEFFCPRCREAVRSTDNDVWFVLTDKTIGKDKHQEIIIKGICEFCNSKLNRFSHSGKLAEIKASFNVIDFGGLENE